MFCQLLDFTSACSDLPLALLQFVVDWSGACVVQVVLVVHVIAPPSAHVHIVHVHVGSYHVHECVYIYYHSHCHKSAMDLHILQCSLKFSRDTVLPILNSAQKQIFMDKIFVVMLPAMYYSCYKLEIFIGEKFRTLTQIHKNPRKVFNLENFRLDGIM